MNSAENTHESSLGAAGIFLGFVLIGIAVVGVIRLRSSELDPAETLGREIQWSALPFGMELESAAQLPELSVSFQGGVLFPPGKQVVRLVDSARPEALEALVAKPEPEPEWDDSEDGEYGSEHDGEEVEGGESEAADDSSAQGGAAGDDSKPDAIDGESEDSDEAADSDEESADWGESGSKSGSGGGWGEPIEALPSEAPLEAVFILFPSPAGVTDTFGRSSFGGWGGGGRGRGRGRSSMGGGGFSFGGPTVLDKGDLTWGEFLVGFVLERSTDDGLRDELRVNLSREDFYCILVLRWAKGEAGDVEQAEEFLRAFKFRSAAPTN